MYIDVHISRLPAVREDKEMIFSKNWSSLSQTIDYTKIELAQPT